jgi:type I restriction enzyme S subunit
MGSNRQMALANADWMRGAHVPAHWRRTKVKHLVTSMAAGDAISAEAIQSTGPYPVYGANGVRGYTDRRNRTGTYVLIGRQGALCGNVHLVSGAIWASEHAIVATPGCKTDPRFLAALLAVMDLGQYSTNAAQPGIGVGQIAPLSAYVPDSDEQRWIADFLDTETAQIDTLISEQERFIALLRERRAAAIDDHFTFTDEVVRTRLKAAISYALTGPFGTQLAADEYVPDGVPVINPTHIRGGLIVADPYVSVLPEKAQVLERFRLAPGDIVLGRKGEVDKSAIVGTREAGYICGSDSMALRSRPGKTVPRYLWWFFQSQTAHRQLELWSVGSTVTGLNQTTIARVTLPLPDVDVQKRVVEELDARVADVERLIAEAEHNIVLSKERRSALITAAVTGQFDVSTGKAA